jgi:hypothetical protein
MARVPEGEEVVPKVAREVAPEGDKVRDGRRRRRRRWRASGDFGSPTASKKGICAQDLATFGLGAVGRLYMQRGVSKGGS